MPQPLIAPEPDSAPRGDLGLRGPAPVLAARAATSGRSLTPLTAGEVRWSPWRLPATSRDVRRLGPVMPPEDKDAALFPRRIDGRWAMIHRPSPLRGFAHMWISYSPDLKHWGDHELLLEARDGAWWDAGKIGLGPPPLETVGRLAHLLPRRPWVGVRADLPGWAGAARSGRAAHCPATNGRMGPRAHGPVRAQRRRQQGRVPDRLGPRPDYGKLSMYYGAGDSAIGLVTAQLGDVLELLRHAPRD